MAAGATYVPIATQTLGTAAASVTFSSIPSTYTDLILVYSGSLTTTNGNGYLQFNSDTTTNYSDTVIYGNGTSALSTRASTQSKLVCFSTGTTQENAILHIMNYANATTYKTVLSRANDAATLTAAYVGLWRSTAAINSVLVGTDVSTFVTGSTFTLYGIAAA